MCPDSNRLIADWCAPYRESAYRAELEVGMQAAVAAAQHAHRQWGNTQVVESRTRHDVKLQLDRECQSLAEQVLSGAYPDDAILGEESADHGVTKDRMWVVDPLDGTVNYFNNFPHWCSSIALQSGGESVVGVVYAPILGECYTATRDGQACLNGEPIQVSSRANLAEACVLSGVSAILDAPDDRFPRLANTLRSTGKIRVLGAAALDQCFVAAGRADGLLEYSLHLWDMAAGSLIVERAGGRFEKVYVQSDLVYGCLCSNGHLHAELRDLFVG